MTDKNDFDFLAESARTASGEFRGELVSMLTLTTALMAFQSAAARLDRIKKLLYYGEDAKKGRFADTMTTSDRATVALEILGGNEAADIIHAILGIASESGELVEALLMAISNEKPLDRTNILEEVGDAQWYEAMIARVYNVDFDKIQRSTIDKLRERFPDKFTTEAANNRNLENERATLEVGLGQDIDPNAPNYDPQASSKAVKSKK